jgi:lysophospholipase L1-like esterase
VVGRGYYPLASLPCNRLVLHQEKTTMPSITVTGSDYLRNADSVEAQGPFTHRLLAEGDSWMDRSTPVLGSLAEFLARELSAQRKSVLIINLSTSGDTMRRITDVMQGEFAWWLRQFRYDGILLSAGGNDFIDAALDPPAGQGILRDMAGKPLPADGYGCVNQQAVATLSSQYLNPSFAHFYQTIRASTPAPIFLNSYDTPVARNAPAFPTFGPWLYAAYQKNHIPAPLWPSLTAGLFRDIQTTINGWCINRNQVHAVPTSGTLTPAKPGTSGSDGDWANEIHPNAAGWKKLAKVWAKELLPILG